MFANEVKIIFIELCFLFAVTMFAFSLRHGSNITIGFTTFFFVLILIDNETFSNLRS